MNYRSANLFKAISVALVFSMVLCGAALAADTIKFGVAGPHSGDLASYGIPTVNAAKLVVADWNAKGGVSGQTNRTGHRRRCL
jgi:branched-chain amino acid transport system substrate-binding protein